MELKKGKNVLIIIALIILSIMAMGICLQNVKADNNKVRSIKYKPAKAKYEVKKYYYDYGDYKSAENELKPKSIPEDDLTIKKSADNMTLTGYEKYGEQSGALHNGDRLTVEYSNGEKIEYISSVCSVRDVQDSSYTREQCILWLDKDGKVNDDVKVLYNYDMSKAKLLKKENGYRVPVTVSLDAVKTEYNMDIYVKGLNDPADKRISKMSRKKIKISSSKKFKEFPVIRISDMKKKYWAEIKVECYDTSGKTTKDEVMIDAEANNYMSGSFGQLFSYDDTKSILIEENGKKIKYSAFIGRGDSMELSVKKAMYMEKEKDFHFSEATKIYYLYDKNNTVKAKPGSKKMTVKWSKVKSASGYQVIYSKNKKFKKAKVKTIKGRNKKNTVISKLKTGELYYIKVRPYKSKNGHKYLGVESGAKKVKIK